ncbi:DNA-binding protein WhiA [Streptococcus sp. 121]|uniref:DNA-binding protein WhiA n=1 Tax=Streptococcus sp. 121 TaxID=2797637 RepID=UPI0018F0EE61|nr:DNA-binding protein WhiA [Streptococcus sp. 121]MBJ6746451.1 DNA-binding protein WhiA [Streptococcus sp. 121]
MSFTSKIKEEILALPERHPAELAALIKLSGSLGLSREGLTLSVTTENAKVARFIYEFLLEWFDIKSDIRHRQKTNLRKNRVYTVFMDHGVKDLLDILGLSPAFFEQETGLPVSIMDHDDAARAYLRGAFLASGSMRDPDSGQYQLEIASVYVDHAQDLRQLMQDFLLDAKVLERKRGAITYIQRAEDLMDFLIIIGALEAMEQLGEIKLMRETRNDLNRATNAETANIARTVKASMKTINNISKIMDHVGLESLSPELQEVARFRIAHPDYSLQELADSLPTPLTKSGLNHRLRRLNKIAEEIPD